MDRERIEKIAETGDDRMLLAKIYEKINTGMQRCIPVSTAFLSPREQEIVFLRYGLEGRKELTQKEVAQEMGISQSYISRLEKRILLRLRKEFLRQTSCA